MQTTKCCEIDTKSQTVESCSIVNVGMKGLLKCPDKQSITAILTKCNKDVCNKILKCCKVHVLTFQCHDFVSEVGFFGKFVLDTYNVI